MGLAAVDLGERGDLITRNRLRDIVPYATSVLLGFGAFFTTLLVFFDSPFAQTHPAPVHGAGLDPLLRNPSMLIHPPMLYSGYTSSRSRSPSPSGRWWFGASTPTGSA